MQYNHTTWSLSVFCITTWAGVEPQPGLQKASDKPTMPPSRLPYELMIKTCNILETLDFPTPTTVAISLAVIEVCSLRVIILECFLRVISISVQAKVKRVSWNEKL
ncbi:hypothetical protein TNCV_4478151 [Trichonephila clavipes]|nr:hypothetical protein TNCV_4478151 [Trichonephila clavipes]